MKKASLKLKGRSGCNLELLSRGCTYIVRKYSKDKNYNQRLFAQVEKQRSFKPNSIFFSPEVINVISDRENTYFEMAYVPGEKYSEYFLNCTISDLNQLISNFISFINSELDLSNFVKLSEDIFRDKLMSIKPIIKSKTNSSSFILKILNRFENEIPSTLIPIGPCHGDLTLSNVIFSNHKLFLIDFLDSFIESPLIDIVKLRQDTKFFWSLMLDTEIPSYQRNKIIQILRYFDTILDNYFKDKDYYRDWYNYLEKFNLIRILPYLEDKNEINFVLDALNKN